jgi:hypothetical protein
MCVPELGLVGVAGAGGARLHLLLLLLPEGALGQQVVGGRDVVVLVGLQGPARQRHRHTHTHTLNTEHLWVRVMRVSQSLNESVCNFVCVCARMCEGVSENVLVCIYVCMYVCMYVYMYVCMYMTKSVHVYMFACMYACMSVSEMSEPVYVCLSVAAHECVSKRVNRTLHPRSHACGLRAPRGRAAVMW